MNGCCGNNVRVLEEGPWRRRRIIRVEEDRGRQEREGKGSVSVGKSGGEE